MKRGELDLAELARRDRQLVELGPFAAPGAVHRLAPFFLVIGAAMLTLGLDSAIPRRIVVTVYSLTALLLLAAVLTPWAKLPRRAQGVLVLIPLFLVDLVLRADDGLVSHFLVLFLVPLAWLALYETRRCLAYGLAITVALLGLEVVQADAVDDTLRAVILAAGALTLLPAIRKLVAVNRAALLALAEMANVDTLTGLANRRGLNQVVQRPPGTPTDGLGMVFIDLDRFKFVNDTYGHDAGDDLLVQVANRIRAAVRTGDVVARIGGDEFVVACVGERSEVAAVADRVSSALCEQPFLIDGHLHAMTASVGTSYLSHLPSDPGVLLDEADQAMYAVKRQHAPAV